MIDANFSAARRAALSGRRSTALAGLGMPASASGAGCSEKILRYAFEVAEPGFDPAQLSDLYSRIVTAHIFDGLTNTTTWRGRSRSAVHRGRHAGDLGRLPRPGPCASNPASSSRTTRRSRASAASWSPRTTSTRSSASSTRAGSRRRYATLAELPYRRHGRRCASDALKNKRALRLRHAGRGPARAGPLHDPVPRRAAAAALPAVARGRRPVRRRRARSRRGLRRHDPGAPGRHRALPPRANGGARRRSCWCAIRPTAKSSTTPNRPPTTPRGRRCCARFKGRRLPMIDRVEISIIEETQPRWLSFLNKQQDLLVAAAVRLHEHRRAQRHAGTHLGAAKACSL